MDDDVPQTFEQFAIYVCNNFQSNDWYCPSYCELLDKASKMDYERIKEKFIEYEGWLPDVYKFIIRAKLNPKRRNKK